MILSGLAVGIALGVVMQRGRFCVTGMIRDIWLNNKWRNLVALFIVISVHAVGLAALTSAGVIAPEYSTFAPAAVAVGGLIFGLGIILAGGCASGTWYRSGEGLVGSWFALLMYAVSAAAMKYGVLADFNAFMKSWDTGWTTLPETFGVSPWYFAVAISVGTALAARHFLAKDAARPKVSLDQPWYRKPLHMYTAGAVIGLLGVLAWPLSAATGRNSGLGITTPTADVLTYSVTADPARFNWGTLLVLGLLVGSFIAAKASGEFRIRVPDATTTVRSIVGGLMMGVGASLAGGCTVGNGMVETSLFSYQGWFAMLFIALGIGAGARWWIKPATTAASTPTRTYSTEESITNDVPVSAEDRVLDAQATPAANFGVATGLITLAKPSVSEKLTPLAPGRFHLDAMGMVCPFPTVEAKDAIRTLEAGDEMVIDFDCTQGTEAIPQWAADAGHTVKDFQQTSAAGWTITVTKDGQNI
ncbi:YeeE/YedE thiosulfate transporter family protein [Corynebacterium guangdongense]|uniref:Membrane protein YedE/YeeE/TusA-related sulfurtransferase n=1 Tax=Corynebacterium guangdongense TaxID=1783348 RepID=A0ABU1ZYM1_9CORY|nr:YeeE/YedE thiosulfate transporter family protein [Corynebacterium guangdongense]MDR7330011.1 putative membrane protein YedE/YeeE/TusA-related sulfurtransferase [Corynebacterium guangdongense]WJZ18569.1 putative inner membrane protein [Corynebacterium guangdongense]